MPETLLSATTSATASREVVVPDSANPVHFTCPGIAGSETGDLQKQQASGTFTDYWEDGTQQQITATNSGLTVYGPGVYRINKSATAASVPVEASSPRTP
jgi:hypothetical protein